ncbi:YtxH domain-containing protein [Pedobacter sp. GR22-6]|uniref:YtxH domain-containing protein n=1 Tax=Pedobacter sp. GR22-6 TaxID=3127957 RepID=UPI00307ED546
MNYKKLIKSTIQGSQDNSLIAVAVVTGLAVGAALSILFAPDSGKNTRSAIGDATAGLKNKIVDKLSPEIYEVPEELKDHLYDDLRETTREHADQLQGPENKRKDPTAIKVPSAGTTAWMHAEEAN